MNLTCLDECLMNFEIFVLRDHVFKGMGILPKIPQYAE